MRNPSLPFCELQRFVFRPFTRRDKNRAAANSVRVHRQLSTERRRVESAKPQTTLEQAAIDGVLQSTREVLSGDERLDGTSHEPLLVHVDQRLEVHGRRKRRERIEHLGMRRRREVAVHRIDADQLCGRRGIDQVG